MRELFLQIMQAWHANTTIPRPRISILPMNMLLNQAYLRQERIGFSNFIQGLHTEMWSEVQRKHYQHSHFGDTFNIRRWENKIIELFSNMDIKHGKIGVIYYTLNLWRRQNKELVKNQYNSAIVSTVAYGNSSPWIVIW